MADTGDIGECSVCGITGPLNEVQYHFNVNHIDAVEDVESNEMVQDENYELIKSSELRWTRPYTLLLIRTVEENYTLFETGLKKNVWIKISAKLSKLTNKVYSYEQVESKWKGLKRTYRKIKDNNNKSGSAAKKWEFFFAMDEFLSKKPEIIPPAVCSTSAAASTSTNSENTKDSERNVNSRTETLSSTIMEKRKHNENIAEKRFQAKLARFDEFLKLYRISVEHQIGKKIDEKE